MAFISTSANYDTLGREVPEGYMETVKRVSLASQQLAAEYKQRGEDMIKANRDDVMAALKAMLSEEDAKILDPQSQQGNKVAIQVNDARALEIPEGLLAGTGFRLFSHSSGVCDWKDDKHVAATYYPELEACLRTELPDAVRFFFLKHVIRSENSVSSPADLVHNDFDASYLDYLLALAEGQVVPGDAEKEGLSVLVPEDLNADDLRSHRVVVINFWRNVGSKPIARKPLALCDRRTVSKTDLVPRSRAAQAGAEAGERPSYKLVVAKENPEHRWYYYSEMRQDEMLGFITYDSHPEGGSFVPPLHSAIDLPNSEGLTQRESCEVRVLCLLPFPLRSRL